MGKLEVLKMFSKGKFDVGVKYAMHLAKLKDLNFQYGTIVLIGIKIKNEWL